MSYTLHMLETGGKRDKWEKRETFNSQPVATRAFVAARRAEHAAVMVTGPHNSITHFIYRRGPITPQGRRRELRQAIKGGGK